MNRHPLSLKGGATCFLMVDHTILSLILKYHFCASSSRELSVCAIFYAFYNSVFDIVWLWWQDYYNFKHQNTFSNFPLLCFVGEHNKIFFYPICHFRFTPASAIAPLLFRSVLTKLFFVLENIVNVYFSVHRCSGNFIAKYAQRNMFVLHKSTWIYYGSNVRAPASYSRISGQIDNKPLL